MHIEKVLACVTDEGQQTDQKCTTVESNRENVKRTTEQNMDGLSWLMVSNAAERPRRQRQDSFCEPMAFTR